MARRISDIGAARRTLSAVPARGATSTGRISRATLTTQLEAALRADIVAGIHAPGQKLRAGEITSLYGVSATPIREALQRLAAEGLVTLDPKVGARVASVSLDDVRDVFAVRLTLESAALALSVRKGGPAWLSEVATTLERLRRCVRPSRDATVGRERMLERVEAHRAFHWALLEACGSPWLLRFIAIIQGHSSRYRMLFLRERAERSWVRDHELIAEAVRRRDARRAVDDLERHTRRGLDVLLRSYRTTAGGRGGAAPGRHVGPGSRA